MNPGNLKKKISKKEKKGKEIRRFKQIYTGNVDYIEKEHNIFNFYNLKCKIEKQ